VGRTRKEREDWDGGIGGIGVLEEEEEEEEEDRGGFSFTSSLGRGSGRLERKKIPFFPTGLFCISTWT